MEPLKRFTDIFFLLYVRARFAFAVLRGESTLKLYHNKLLTTESCWFFITFAEVKTAASFGFIVFMLTTQ
jgi:hypothetical protein